MPRFRILPEEEAQRLVRRSPTDELASQIREVPLNVPTEVLLETGERKVTVKRRLQRAAAQIGRQVTFRPSPNPDAFIVIIEAETRQESA